MKTQNDERNAIVAALLAFVNLRKNEEREFIAALNLLLRVSPRKRREMIDQLRQDASGEKEYVGIASRFRVTPGN
jgi:hypothetical protein